MAGRKRLSDRIELTDDAKEALGYVLGFLDSGEINFDGLPSGLLQRVRIYRGFIEIYELYGKKIDPDSELGKYMKDFICEGRGSIEEIEACMKPLEEYFGLKSKKPRARRDRKEQTEESQTPEPEGSGEWKTVGEMAAIYECSISHAYTVLRGCDIEKRPRKAEGKRSSTEYKITPEIEDEFKKKLPVDQSPVQQ